MTTVLPLDSSTLHRLRGRLDVPAYDRRLRPAVVHLSVGHFHRSHQAAYLDALARTGDRGWGLTGVSVRHRATADALRAQDGLYTLVERDASGDRAAVIGVMGDCLFAPEEHREVVARIADPVTQVVTLTVTGGGYTAGGPAIGLLVEGIARRTTPLTVISCDNFADNGRVAERAVLEAAGRRDPALAARVARLVAFPSSMVDRITPTTSDADRLAIAAAFGVDDRCPVQTERYTQWVIEDAFAGERPALETVGVTFVPDVRPYGLVKTRLLNGAHCALGYLGLLAGHRDTVAAMGDPVLRGALTRLMDAEVAPLLPAVPGMHDAAFRRTLLARIANPRMPDPLARLARNGSTKVPEHLLSSLAEARLEGRPHEVLTLAVAGWCAHLRTSDVSDPEGARLGSLAMSGGTDPRPLLRGSGLFGALAHDDALAAELARTLTAFEHRGVRATVAERLRDARPLAA